MAKAGRLYLYAASELDVFAQKGDMPSQNNLALMYEQGLGVNKNMQTAQNWYRKAALAGYAESQYHMGRILSGVEGVESDEAQALYWLEAAAAQGFQKAKSLLARLRQSDNGIAFAD